MERTSFVRVHFTEWISLTAIAIVLSCTRNSPLVLSNVRDAEISRYRRAVRLPQTTADDGTVTWLEEPQRRPRLLCYERFETIRPSMKISARNVLKGKVTKLVK